MSKFRCGFCKDYFDQDKEGVVRVGPQSFCCSDHRIAAANKNRKPPKPVKPKAKKDDTPPETKRLVKKLDGNRCRYCGIRTGLHVHHVIYRGHPDGTHEVTNLITLCKSHHDLVHSDKKKYQPMCKEIVRRRTETGDTVTLIRMLELVEDKARNDGRTGT